MSFLALFYFLELHWIDRLKAQRYRSALDEVESVVPLAPPSCLVEAIKKFGLLHVVPMTSFDALFCMLLSVAGDKLTGARG